MWAILERWHGSPGSSQWLMAVCEQHPPCWDLGITSQNPLNSSRAHSHVDGGGGAITQNGKAWFRKAWTSSPNWSNSIITTKLKWSQRKNAGILRSCTEKAPKWKESIETVIISYRNLVSNN